MTPQLLMSILWRDHCSLGPIISFGCMLFSGVGMRQELPVYHRRVASLPWLGWTFGFKYSNTTLERSVSASAQFSCRFGEAKMRCNCGNRCPFPFPSSNSSIILEFLFFFFSLSVLLLFLIGLGWVVISALWS